MIDNHARILASEKAVIIMPFRPIREHNIVWGTKFGN